MRVCRTCNVDQPLAGFAINQLSFEGRKRQCKRCETKKQQERDAVADPALRRERRKAVYAKDPARYVADTRKWREEHPEAVRAASATRRARKRGAFVEQVYALVVLEDCDGVCGLCGEDVDPLDFEVDHVRGLADGGAHAYYNVQVAHPYCNGSKGKGQ